MKKYINKIILALFAITTLVSCDSDPDNVVYDVFDGLTHGAVLRTLDIVSPTFDVVDLNSSFEIEIEAQDEQNGALLSQVEVFVNAAGASEVLLRTLPASSFVTTANDYPGTTINITLQEALDALGLSSDDVECGDTMEVRLKVDLTDGRSFTNTDASGSLQGSYFQSPYIYLVDVVANLPSETLYTGQYMLETVTPGIFGVADYLDGVYTIEAVSNTIRVIKDVTTFPAFGGFGPVDLQLNFVCGEIVFPSGQGVGAGCGGGTIINGTADVNATYDIDTPDDSSFIVNITSSENDNCTSSVQAVFRLTKL